MTDLTFEARTEKRLEAILDELRALRSLVEERLAPAQQVERPGDVLSLKDASRHLGVAPQTLQQGAAGTKVIPRYSDRPVQYLRSSLDKFKRARVEREAAMMSRPKKISLVRRKPRA